MSAVKPCLIRSYDAAGGPVVRVGVPLADDYLEFLAGRCRPNTVLAGGYDLRVFFAAVGKPPAEVGPADVLGFITAQRTGRARNDGVVVPLQDGDEPGGVSGGDGAAAVDDLGVVRVPARPGDVPANPVRVTNCRSVCAPSREAG